MFAIVDRFTVTHVAKLPEGGYASAYYYVPHLGYRKLRESAVFLNLNVLSQPSFL